VAKGIEIKTRINRVQPEGNHRLRVWVSRYEDMEPEIFVYQRFPDIPGDDNPQDRFVNIASVADMAEYPKTTPDAHVPFFRLGSIDLIYRSVAALDDAVEHITADVEALVNNLNALDALGTTDTYDYGYISSSSSSSSSQSSSSSSHSVSTSSSSSHSNSSPSSASSSSSSTSMSSSSSSNSNSTSSSESSLSSSSRSSSSSSSSHSVSTSSSSSSPSSPGI